MGFAKREARYPELPPREGIARVQGVGQVRALADVSRAFARSGTALARLPAMLHLLAGLALLISLADHWTTYLCLRGAVAGWEVTEANPLAEWLFARVGLAEGLIVDTLVTALVLVFVVHTPRIARSLKLTALSVLIAITSWAVVNNVHAVQQLGLSLTGSAT